MPGFLPVAGLTEVDREFRCQLVGFACCSFLESRRDACVHISPAITRQPGVAGLLEEVVPKLETVWQNLLDEANEVGDSFIELANELRTTEGLPKKLEVEGSADRRRVCQ